MSVSLEQVDISWDGVEETVLPYLNAAMVRGENRDWTMEQVLEKLRENDWGLYLVMDRGKPIGAGVTAITCYGMRKVLDIIMFGADIQSKEWKKVLDSLKAQAKLHGCSAVGGRGRPGWARYLGATPVNAFELEV